MYDEAKAIYFLKISLKIYAFLQSSKFKLRTQLH